MSPPAPTAQAAADLNGRATAASMPAGGLPAARGGRLAIGLVAAVVVLAGVLVLSVMVGSKAIPGTVIWEALRNFDPSNNDHLFVREERVPRTLVGLLVGAGLGLAGTVMQAVARNPLADPGVLGINAGAALCVVVGIHIFGVSALTGYVWFGFVGALIATVMVYGVGSIGREGATPVKLALSGAATNAAFLSLTTVVLMLDPDTFDQFRLWQVGSLSGRGMDVFWQVLPFIAIGSLLALASGRMLNALAMGEDVARSLGQNVTRARILAACAVVLLCGAGTAAAGPIAFVGLAVPLGARLITGPDHRWILPYSMVMAPILVLGADVLGRVIARPGEVQVGILTAVIGAPIFIALVRRRTISEL